VGTPSGSQENCVYAIYTCVLRNVQVMNCLQNITYIIHRKPRKFNDDLPVATGLHQWLASVVW
jgi:hypothetical protein